MVNIYINAVRCLVTVVIGVGVVVVVVVKPDRAPECSVSPSPCIKWKRLTLGQRQDALALPLDVREGIARKGKILQNQNERF